MPLRLCWLVGLALFLVPLVAADDKPADADKPESGPMSADTFAGLALRGIGPAMTGGRVVDFAVDPNNRAHYFVAVAAGGVWKTTDGGTTFTPVFEHEGAFSIGCVTLDPHNSNVVWVGTGENNSQRSVDFGDGVYRSRDGGQNWENLGLKQSEHIGMIRIDPRDSNVVYVAAQGPLWRSGGDRGLYKTTDGGKTWQCVLHISDDTGVNEVHFDPRNPDVLYASAYQRRRHVWTLIDGGPESAIYKSEDAGATWRKVTKGLPEVDLGRIGLGVSPANPDVVYAIVEAADGKSGFFRSLDRGETWEKRSDYATTSPQYYNELICDPCNVDRVYLEDTFLSVTEDGGATFSRMPRTFRHVDDHAMWIDPHDTDYLLTGCDGGIYETFDRGKSWRFMSNLSIAQFYRITADDSTPFYYVYGGTQDNGSLGAPSRTRSPAGIVNEDWFLTVGGDGYKSQIDPRDPMIVYAEWQYGGLVRFDRRSGQTLDIKPVAPPGAPPLRWNWDSPLIISPHDHTRLYFAANILFRSDNRGESWTAISGDLTRQLDRNQLEIMGRVWDADAVEKNGSTSWYGNCVTLAESPVVAGLLYVGTDDGLIQVTEDDGQHWRTVESFPGVPDRTYVSALLPSRQNADTVYAAFDNHKMGDFKPYVVKSTDRGRTWTSIAGDLPEREFVLSLAEDQEKPGLLFAGTEFGVFFTIDGGQRWIKLKGGIPTISVRDLSIQRRENDLVLATFGRGVYILDDYTPLRLVNDELLNRAAVLFPVKDALRYLEWSRLGGEAGRGSQGSSYFAAPNPPYGAVFTYYLKDKLLTLKERRHEAEKAARKEGRTPPYPSIEELRREDEEQEPQILLTVRDEEGNVVRRIEGARDKGIHRVAWDLRYPAATPASIAEVGEREPWDREPAGPMTLPGTYTVELAKVENGTISPLVDPVAFRVVPLELATFPAKDKAAVLAFQQKSARLQRAVEGSLRFAGEMEQRLAHLRAALLETPAADPAMLSELNGLRGELETLLIQLRGDTTLQKREEPTPPSIRDRVGQLIAQWDTTSPPTATQEEAYRWAGEEFGPVLAGLRDLAKKLTDLESRMEAAGAPWTPGRLPDWSPE